jgi:hypothetical protein
MIMLNEIITGCDLEIIMLKLLVIVIGADNDDVTKCYICRQEQN